MKTATATLVSASPYSQSRNYERDIPALDKEGKDEYEKRTWRNRLHVDGDGMVIIPAMALKFSLDATSKYLGWKIPGQRNARYTKHFLAGVLVLDSPALPVAASDVPGEWVFVNADGVRGSGKRVWRCFPRIDKWQADVTFHVADETITKDVLEAHLHECGKFVGIGRFAPRSGGPYGRFEVKSVSWS